MNVGIELDLMCAASSNIVRSSSMGSAGRDTGPGRGSDFGSSSESAIEYLGSVRR